jgi:hypothetical protein
MRIAIRAVAYGAMALCLTTLIIFVFGAGPMLVSSMGARPDLIYGAVILYGLPPSILVGLAAFALMITKTE